MLPCTGLFSPGGQRVDAGHCSPRKEPRVRQPWRVLPCPGAHQGCRPLHQQPHLGLCCSHLQSLELTQRSVSGVLTKVLTKPLGARPGSIQEEGTATRGQPRLRGRPLTRPPLLAGTHLALTAAPETLPAEGAAPNHPSGPRPSGLTLWGPRCSPEPRAVEEWAPGVRFPLGLPRSSARGQGVGPSLTCSSGVRRPTV